MNNSLTLLALIPLMGPEPAEIPEPARTIQIVRSADTIPVLPSVHKPVDGNLTPNHETQTRTRTHTTNINITDNLPNPLQNTNSNPITNPITNLTTNPITNPITTNPNGIAATSPTSAAPVSNELTTNGMLEVPKRNQIVITAPCSAILMSLRTADGNSGENLTDDETDAITQTLITEGMYVKKGQLLGKLDDRTLQNQLKTDIAQLNVAIAAEKKVIEIEYAQKTVELAEIKLRQLKEANQLTRDTVPQIEILQADHERLQAVANVDLLRYVIENERSAETDVRRQMVEATKTNIKIRQLIAPIDGVITEIKKSEGEYVREGDSILEITQLETLRALCKVSAAYCSQSQLEGKDVTVQVKMVNEQVENFHGKIVFVNPKIITASNEFEIYIEVQNQRVENGWRLQPGSQVTAKIKL
ncbi:MAG: HlyD family efflux transporter periplasmic adaptor subunit [Planctomycetaceae bacterium]|jgi:multidrug efflux pump subunit AcrA (membrane-fusion protein)|nr:HlyD family efflux transporter periplasmic adaptor subunit [Planctomycetaceae bacterium]